MKRPYKCKCFLISKKLDEMDIKQRGEEANLLIDLDQVESVRELIDDFTEEISEVECMVYLKSGQSFVVGRSYKEFTSAI